MYQEIETESRSTHAFSLASRNIYSVSAKAKKISISVVIAWVNDFDLLSPGLEGLLRGHRKPDEIIVVTRRGEKDRQILTRNFSQVILISAPANTPITTLRSIGAKRAAGGMLVITEDHCVPSENWLQAAEMRIRAGADAVGGPVENSWEKRWRDQAAFLTEYAFALKSAAHENAEENPLAGNNIAYRRELIKGLCETLDANLWESFYHDRLKSEGKKFVYDSGMLLYHNRPFDFFYFIKQRFHFCRSFAEMRSQFLNNFGRAKYGLACGVLPLLLWLRGLGILIEKRRFIGSYLFCSPLIAVYLCAGAYGEMIGYFFGDKGKSLARIE